MTKRENGHFRDFGIFPIPEGGENVDFCDFYTFSCFYTFVIFP
jgi:hypothetical protein